MAASTTNTAISIAVLGALGVGGWLLWTTARTGDVQESLLDALGSAGDFFSSQVDTPDPLRSESKGVDTTTTIKPAAPPTPRGSAAAVVGPGPVARVERLRDPTFLEQSIAANRATLAKLQREGAPEFVLANQRQTLTDLLVQQAAS